MVLVKKMVKVQRKKEVSGAGGEDGYGSVARDGNGLLRWWIGWLWFCCKGW
jgi:hypothetical protein